MPKAKKTVSVLKCQCSVCGQVAFVEENTLHFHCRGIRLVRPLPAMFSQLAKPDNKGVWLKWFAPTPMDNETALPPTLDPALQGAVNEPMVATA